MVQFSIAYLIENTSRTCEWTSSHSLGSPTLYRYVNTSIHPHPWVTVVIGGSKLKDSSLRFFRLLPKTYELQSESTNSGVGSISFIGGAWLGMSRIYGHMSVSWRYARRYADSVCKFGQLSSLMHAEIVWSPYRWDLGESLDILASSLKRILGLNSLEQGVLRW